MALYLYALVDLEVPFLVLDWLPVCPVKRDGELWMR